MHKILRLKQDVTLKGGFEFKKGTEFEVLNDVVYMSGLPVSINTQHMLLNWIKENPTIFKEDYRGK